MFFNMHILRQKKYLSNLGLNINTVTLLFANAATINSKLINKGINLLNNEKYFDSAVTTSVYNMWSPVRARVKNKKKLFDAIFTFKNNIKSKF